MSKKTILIVGAGALGTFFAAKLAQAGIKITILDEWHEAINALNTQGATLIDNDGQKVSSPVNAATHCKQVDLALVLVKSWQTEQIAIQLSECLSPNGLAITLQNGWGNGKILASVLGAERVAQGVTTTGAALVAPGVVRAGGEGLVSLEMHPRLGAFTALLAETGIQSEVVSNAASLVWSKLIINAAINPLTALLDIPNGELIKRPSARKLMGELAHETAAVAKAQNIALSFNDPIHAVEEVAQRTARNSSSMRQDLRRGAPTEINAICGAIARIGKKCGVPAPLNETMTMLIKARIEGEPW